MAIANEDSSMVMPVTPMGGYGYGNGGGFGVGSDWIILFLLFAVFGGYGNGFGGFGGGAVNGMEYGMFPWLLAANNNTGNLVTNGFDNAAVTGQLNNIQSSIVNGFSNAEISACGRAADSMATAYNNQIASMNQNFANQQALDNRLYAMQSEQQNCCCENRLALANLGADIARENCADRAAVSDGIRDIITSQTAGTQAILDKLCQQELDAERRENANLRSRINMLDLAASQSQQTATLIADNTAQTQYIVNRVAPYPIPSYIVSPPYGYYGGMGGYPNCGYGV